MILNKDKLLIQTLVIPYYDIFLNQQLKLVYFHIYSLMTFNHDSFNGEE